ncbi:MAG: dihydroorotate dehydrogenase-like protein [Candidatus Eisenbacteria bacterium]|nr:dihydroorotate dehydrogenase-like protein [Candidatus Eisenbacteria bacterium]
MDLTTRYLGLELPHPLMPGASPLAYDLDRVRALEDAGAAAIVMPSLFEEQLVAEETATRDAIDEPAESFPEALSYFPDPGEYRLGPEEYLEQIRKIKSAVDIPVIASLNGITAGGWVRYAQQMASAGADALELNVYDLATDPAESATEREERLLQLVRTLKQIVSVPVVIKLSPFYTTLPNVVHRLGEVGADGVVLFNRFYQPDLDIEELDVKRTLRLSTSAELLPRLRWLAILAGRVELSLAASGGVHTAEDALKAIMAGADAVQMVSLLLREGPEKLGEIRTELSRWLESHDYESLDQARGSLSLLRSPDPGAYERANYVQILQSWRA